MDPDQEICLCFHVTRRKIVNYLRSEQPGWASQLSECHGAGTGCGWCRPFLQRLFEANRAGRLGATADRAAEAPDPETYARARAIYLQNRPAPADGPDDSTPTS